MKNQTLAQRTTAQSRQLYYIDWLRVIAILLVFLIHSSKIFDYHTEVVANVTRSPVLTAFRDFILLWVMPLFFVLSGAAIFLSKGPEKPGKFIKSRFLRLLVPMLFVGTFLVNSLYVYIERVSGGETTSSFFQWYPQYFDGVYGFGGNLAPLGQGTHLWYLEFLFIYSLILLPLFVRSKKRGTSFLARISPYFENPWSLLLLFLPVAVISAVFEIAGLGGVRVMGGWDPISYLFFLGYGYLLFSNEKIGETIKKYMPIYLAVAVVLTGFFIDTHFGFIVKIPGLTRHDLLNDGALLPLNQVLWTSVQALRGLLAWSWILGLLGLPAGTWISTANSWPIPTKPFSHSISYTTR